MNIFQRIITSIKLRNAESRTREIDKRIYELSDNSDRKKLYLPMQKTI